MKYSFPFYTSATEIVYFSNSFYDEIITFGVSPTQALLCNWRTQRSSPDFRGTRSHGLPFTIPTMDCYHPACVPLRWTNAQYCRIRFTKLLAWYFLWYLSSNKLYEPFGMFVLSIGIYGALAQVILAVYFSSCFFVIRELKTYAEFQGTEQVAMSSFLNECITTSKSIFKFKPKRSHRERF